MLASEIREGTLLAGDSREYRLGPVLAEGGEGVVFFVEGRDDVVAKLYKDAEYGRDVKLRGLIELGTKRLRRVAAWPLSSLFDPHDQPVGFVMESLEEWQPLHAVYQIRSRLHHSPNHTWAFLVRVARNLATCVHHIHEHGLVIGDLNESNVLVGPDAMVKLIDADSFQVRLEGRLYPCKVAKPELLAPELQGMSLEGTERTPDQDRFALAVLIFQTLLFGRHPFAGRPQDDTEVSLERAIEKGWYVFAEGEGEANPLMPPPHLTLDGLTPTVKRLFRRAFDPAEPVRPSGREWFAALKELEGALRPCPINGSHVFGFEGMCPWCALEEKWNITLFRPAPSDPLSAADFDIDAVWNGISQLPVPWSERRPEPINYWTMPPAELSPWVRFGIRPVKLILYDNAFWFVMLCGVLGLTPSALTQIGPLGLAMFAGVFAGIAAGVYTNAVRRKVRRANRRLTELAKEWETEADIKLYSDRLTVYSYERNALVANLDRYEAARQVRIRELHRPDMERFLRKYTIMAADAGPGVEAKKRLNDMRDHGIATAADIDPAVLAEIRNLDPTILLSLVAWRKALEEQFWSATSYGLPPHEERAVLQRIYREDVTLRRDLRDAQTELGDLANSIRSRQQALLAEAESHEETVRRYGAVLVALERRRGKAS